MSVNFDIRGDGVSPTLKTSRMSVYLSDTGITTITIIITISIAIVITIVITGSPTLSTSRIIVCFTDAGR